DHLVRFAAPVLMETFLGAKAVGGHRGDCCPCSIGQRLCQAAFRGCTGEPLTPRDQRGIRSGRECARERTLPGNKEYQPRNSSPTKPPLSAGSRFVRESRPRQPPATSNRDIESLHGEHYSLHYGLGPFTEGEE